MTFSQIVGKCLHWLNFITELRNTGYKGDETFPHQCYLTSLIVQDISYSLCQLSTQVWSEKMGNCIPCQTGWGLYGDWNIATGSFITLEFDDKLMIEGLLWSEPLHTFKKHFIHIWCYIWDFLLKQYNADSIGRNINC